MITDPSTQIVTIVVGVAALILGRRLFWLAVGVVGFIIGLNLAVEFFQDQPDWVILMIALLMGIGGGVLAIVLQKIAVTVAGLVMGGYALVWVWQLFSIDTGQMEWLIFVLIFAVGAMIGGLAATYLFEAALIILSSLAGTLLIIQVTNFSPPITALLFVVLLITGIAIQAGAWNRSAVSPPPGK